MAALAVLRGGVAPALSAGRWSCVVRSDEVEELLEALGVRSRSNRRNHHNDLAFRRFSQLVEQRSGSAAVLFAFNLVPLGAQERDPASGRNSAGSCQGSEEQPCPADG